MVEIIGDGWRAELLLSERKPPECNHLEAKVEGDTKALALAGAEWIMNSFGAGRTCMIRVAPEADTWKNFDTKAESHRGYVRFSYVNSPSNWQTSKYGATKITSLGAA